MHTLQIPSNEVKPHVTLLYLGGDLTDESAAKRANLNLREFQHAKEAMILDDWRVFMYLLCSINLVFQASSFDGFRNLRS